MELLRRTFGARGWLTDEGHALLVAVSRVTPGTNILAYCVALGWQLGHWRGALAALAAASVPASLLIALLSATLGPGRSASGRARGDRRRADRRRRCSSSPTAWHLLRPFVKGTNAIRTGIIAAIVVVIWS